MARPTWRIDEALLDAVAADAETAYLRAYGWTVPTLSLGYFQHLADVQADARWQSVAVVRRLTGGGAIWHHHEVTYALIVPAGHPRRVPITALYRAVHAAIAETLAGVGIKADRRGDAAPSETTGRKRPLLCFTDRDSEDLVYQGFKIVGRRNGDVNGAILQHGSILLARSPRVPELPGLGDLADVYGVRNTGRHDSWSRSRRHSSWNPKPSACRPIYASRHGDWTRPSIAPPTGPGPVN